MSGYSMEEDRSPTYFLGITSMLMLFTFFIPLALQLFSAVSTGVHFAILLIWRRLCPRCDSDASQKPRANCQSSQWNVNVMREAARRSYRCTSERLKVYWTHPSLLVLQDLPSTLGKILQPRYVLCALWMLSVYFFMIQVPKARLLEILELDPTDASITASQIKTAYKKLSFKYHPDHGHAEAHREKYEQVRKAYKRLKAAQKAREAGGNEEDYLDDDGERGISMPIPLFLRQYSIDRPGRTVFFLLIIAFGLPLFLVYHLLFRTGGQKSSARSTGIRSYADYQRYIKRIDLTRENLEALFMSLGNILEVPLPRESSGGTVCDGMPSPREKMDRVMGESSPEESNFPEPLVKMLFEPVSSEYLAIVFSYIDVVVHSVIEKIIPIDIQSKHKKLLQLYEERKSIIRRINETVWKSKRSCLEIIQPESANDESITPKTEALSNSNSRFLRHAQNRYRVEKEVRAVDETTDTLAEDEQHETDAAEKKIKDPFLSQRLFDKLDSIAKEILQLYAEIEKSSFAYLSSYHTRSRKREEKSKKIKKEKQAARS